MGKRILIGVTGGIAVYKICSLVRILKSKGWEVKVIMTKNAQKFVTPLTFEVLTENPVYIEMFGASRDKIQHIALRDWADVVLIAPATANIIGKAAGGIADDLLSTTCLALYLKTPKYMAPAMNTEMWLNSAVRENLPRLRKSNWHIIEPQTKKLACGDEGMGALAKIECIIEVIEGAQI